MDACPRLSLSLTAFCCQPWAAAKAPYIRSTQRMHRKAISKYVFTIYIYILNIHLYTADICSAKICMYIHIYIYIYQHRYTRLYIEIL